MAITINHPAVEEFIADAVRSGQFPDDRSALEAILTDGLALRQVDPELQAMFDQADAELESDPGRLAEDVFNDIKLRYFPDAKW